jgi:hypothetical protein
MRFGLVAIAILLPSGPVAAQVTAPNELPIPGAPMEAIGPAGNIPPSEPWQPPNGAADPTAAGPQAPEELPAPMTWEGLPDQSKYLLEAEPRAWYAPSGWLGPEPWDSGIELGLNGSSGTSDSFSMRSGAYIKRESRFSQLDLSAYYNLTVNGGKATQDNAQFESTQDWLIDEKSPWTLFLATDLFYDKFQSFDVQTDMNLGVGYRIVHTPELELMTRVGGGASREFGGPENDWVPESLVGWEYTQRIAKTQKLYAKFDYYPEWNNGGEYRMLADTGWEIELVQPSNLSLKISATDRYDSSPGGVSPHLLNYSVVLLMKL